MFCKIILMMAVALLLSHTAFAQNTPTDTATANRQVREARTLINAKNWDAVLSKLDSAEVIYKATLGEKSEPYCAIVIEQASTWLRKGDFARAKVLFERALTIVPNALGENHLMTAKLYANYGVFFLQTKQLDKAEMYMLKTYDIRVKLLGDFAQETFEICNNLSILYQRMGKFDKAVMYAEKILAYTRTKFGEEHERTAYSYSIVGEQYHYLFNFPKALDAYQRALKIYAKNPEKNTENIGQLNNNLVHIYQQSGDLENAIEAGQLALRIWRNKRPPDWQSIGTTLLNIGVAEADKGDMAAALDTLEKAMAALRAAPERDIDMEGRVFNAIGNIHKRNGDFGKAINFFEKTLSMLIEAHGPKYAEIATEQMNIANCLSIVGRHAEALDIANQSLALTKEGYDTESIPHSDAVADIGNIYGRRGDYKQALAKHLVSYTTRLKVLGSDEHPNLDFDFHNLGLAYRFLGIQDSAILFFNKAIAVKTKKYGPKHPSVANSFGDLALAYGKNGQFQKGEEALNQCFASLNFGDTSDFKIIAAMQVLVEMLHAKGDFYLGWYKISHEKRHLEEANQAYRMAILAMDFHRQKMDNALSKLSLSRERHGVFEGGIEVCFKQGMTDNTFFANAFDFAEHSKSMLLYESIKQSEALHFGGIPYSLLQQEYDLRVDITYNEKRRQELLSQKLPETDTTVLKISAKLFDFNRRFETLTKRFETDYPDYYRLKYDLSTVSVTEVQQKILKPGQTMVEYFTGDSSLFIFAITKKKFVVKEVKKGDLDTLVNAYLDNVSQPRRPFRRRDGWVLYQKLLLPVRDLLGEELIIIPDGVLSKLPFEALLDAPPPPQDTDLKRYPFLLKKHRVRYCYSATMLREMMEKQHRDASAQGWAVFAPLAEHTFTAGRDTLVALPETLLEAACVESTRVAQTFIGEEATEAAFVHEAGRFRVLYITSHGELDTTGRPEYTYIPFCPLPDTLENEKLFIREIYNLSLNADLVVVSTCLSAGGELHRGEGTISLARAFTYAGAKSLVTSLYKVGEISTKDLMCLFLRHLAAGLPTDEALRQAKLDFMEKEKDGGHPFKWAGFVAIGAASEF